MTRQMTGAEFRVIRDGLGLPTKWVARALGVSPRTVARWEAGESWIQPEVAAAIRDWSNRTEVQIECAILLADSPGVSENFREKNLGNFSEKNLVEKNRSVYAGARTTAPGQELLTYATDADYRAAHPTGSPPFTAAWHRLATYRIAAATGMPVTFSSTPDSANRDWTTKCQ